MGASVSQEAAPLVPLRQSVDVFVDGCNSPRRCYLQRVRQYRSLRAAIDALSESYSAPRLRGFLSKVPRPGSVRTDPLRVILFWENLTKLAKVLANLSPAQVRPLFSGDPGRRDRQSLSFSLSLLGKSLHAPCSCYAQSSFSGDGHRASLTRPDGVSAEFIGFAGDMSKRLFKRGWDSAYFSSCVSSSVSANGCYETPRSGGGSLSHFSSQKEYLDRVMGVEPFRLSPIGRFQSVCSAGKMRPLTIMHSSYEYLRPLHKTLYNHLSSMPWCLRGSPDPSKMSGLLSLEGDFVSVDFQSATDNLSVNVAERVLGVALGRARSVPDLVKKAALESLRPEVVYEPLGFALGVPGSSGVLSMGQMMGQLLSFPLLCLQTFFFYLWSAGLTDLPGRLLREFSGCLVNGDDLLFRSKNPSSFFSAAAATPSVINGKKTQVSSRYLNINSTLFEFRSGAVVCVPFLRPAQFTRDSPLSLGESVREATRWLKPGSRLQRSSFDWLMRASARLVRSFGWSFYKSGFRGEKQVRWLRDHKCLSYEADVFSRFSEGPAPEFSSWCAEEMVPLPPVLSRVPNWALVELVGVATAFGRFRFSPSNFSKFDVLKECEAQRVDVRRSVLDSEALASKCKRMGFSPPSRFPVMVGDVLYRRNFSLVNACRKRMLEEKGERVFVPRILVDALSDSRLLGGFEVHDAVWDRVRTIFWRVREAARTGLCR